MNAQPHTHELTIRVDDDGDVRVGYGDQYAWLFRHFGVVSERRIRRAARRVVRKHDRGSVKAGRTTSAASSVLAEADRFVSQKWPS